MKTLALQVFLNCSRETHVDDSYQPNQAASHNVTNNLAKLDQACTGWMIMFAFSSFGQFCAKLSGIHPRLVRSKKETPLIVLYYSISAMFVWGLQLTPDGHLTWIVCNINWLFS